MPARLFRGCLCLPLLLALLVSPALRAQDNDNDGPTSIPGGTMVRGTVTSVEGNTITVQSEEGDTLKIAVTPNTRVMHDRQPGRATDLRAGDGVGAGGILDPNTHTLHAAFVGYIDAEELRRAQADLGKTYIVGRITAIDIDHLRLTIHRPDNTSQIIAVDESTDFRRGGHSPGPAADAANQPAHAHSGPAGSNAQITGEPITLADLQVGESVAGRGSIKHGLFTPTELHVSPPRTHHGDTAPQSPTPGARP